MNLHVCKHMCWHLVAKNSFGDGIFHLQEITELSKAWDFVREMKQNFLIEEIIWTRHEARTGKIYDETVHLKRKNGEWLRNDIADWKIK